MSDVVKKVFVVLFACLLQVASATTVEEARAQALSSTNFWGVSFAEYRSRIGESVPFLPRRLYLRHELHATGAFVAGCPRYYSCLYEYIYQRRIRIAKSEHDCRSLSEDTTRAARFAFLTNEDCAAYYVALADEKGRCDMSDFPFGGEYRA